MKLQKLLKEKVLEEQKKYNKSDFEIKAPLIQGSLDLSLSFVKDTLREADEEEEDTSDQEEDEAGGDEETPEGPQPSGAPPENPDAVVGQPQDAENSPPLEDEMKAPIADGQVPIDNAGIQNYDPLNPIGEADITFAEGNYPTIQGLPKLVADKTNMVTRTFVPLVEVQLIELLGSSQQYERQSATINPSFNQTGEMYIQGTFIYFIRDWVGLDIQLDQIQHDSNYILDKLKPSGATVTKCEINVSEGTLTIQFNI